MEANNSIALRQVIMSRSNMTQFIESPPQEFLAKHSTNVDTISPVELYVVIALLVVMSVIGTAGNLCVMCVYLKKKENLVSNHFIIVLAVVDFTTCLVIIPYTIFMEYVEFYVTSDLCCKFYHFLITSNIPFSALIMVAIAVDRYLCICHPFQRVMTMNRAKALSVTLAMFACLLGVFVALIYGVYQIQQPNNSTSTEALIPVSTIAMKQVESVLQFTTSNQDGASFGVSAISPSSDQPVLVNLGLCQINDIYISQTFQWYYHRFFLAMYPFCLFVVVVLYILIFRSVRARRCLRQEQKSKSLALVQSLMSRTKRTSAPTNSLTEDNLIEAAAATPATTPNGDQPPISKGIATVRSTPASSPSAASAAAAAAGAASAAAAWAAAARAEVSTAAPVEQGGQRVARQSQDRRRAVCRDCRVRRDVRTGVLHGHARRARERHRLLSLLRQQRRQPGHLLVHESKLSCRPGQVVLPEGHGTAEVSSGREVRLCKEGRDLREI